MRASVYGALATLVLALSTSGFFPWLQGRRNSDFPGLLLNLAGFAVWLGLAAALLWEAISARPDERAGLRVLRFVLCFVLLAIACLPWALSAVCPDATSAFSSGFRSWAAAEIDVPAIRSWQAGLAQLPPPTSAPGWWLTTEREVVIGAQPARESLVAAVSGLRPSEVRVIANPGAVLLAWDGRRAGWQRFAFVGPSGLHLPTEFSEEHVRWYEAKPGVLVGIADQP